MSSQSIQSKIDGLRKTVVGLRKNQNKYEADAQKAAQNASAKFEQAAKTRSESSARSYFRQGEQYQKAALAAGKKANDCAAKIADAERKITSEQKSLASALQREGVKAERDRASRQRTLDRETKKRRDEELKHAREVARLTRPEVRHVIVPEPKPEKLRILYLTANPDLKRPLRTEAEVGSVLRELRGARYRDMVDLQSRPAATPQDLLNGINDVRPHVVHFSGHGDAGLLAFDNASMDDPQSVAVQFDDLAAVLDATDTPPTLLVMNACSTLHGSDVLLEAVPILIAMADPVGDAAAGVFAMQFYSAIASGQSVASALKQAKVKIKLALDREEADLPRLRSRADVDPATVSLVDDKGSVDRNTEAA